MEGFHPHINTWHRGRLLAQISQISTTQPCRWPWAPLFLEEETWALFLAQKGGVLGGKARGHWWLTPTCHVDVLGTQVKSITLKEDICSQNVLYWGKKYNHCILKRRFSKPKDGAEMWSFLPSSTPSAYLQLQTPSGPQLGVLQLGPVSGVHPAVTMVTVHTHIQMGVGAGFLLTACNSVAKT